LDQVTGGGGAENKAAADAVIAKLKKHGEGAALQIVVGNEGNRYNDHYKHMLLELQKGKSVAEALRVAETTIGRELQKLRKELMSSQNEKDREMQLRMGADKVAQEEIERKVKSVIAPVNIRLVASAADDKRAQELLANLIAPFSQYSDAKGNHLRFKQLGWWGLSSFVRDFTYRTFDAAHVLPLSLSELTAIFHFTAEKVNTSRELKKSYAKQAPAPVEMPHDGITIGLNHYGAEETEVKAEVMGAMVVPKPLIAEPFFVMTAPMEPTSTQIKTETAFAGISGHGKSV
jgi:hypothetical protein